MKSLRSGGRTRTHRLGHDHETQRLDPGSARWPDRRHSGWVDRGDAGPVDLRHPHMSCRRAKGDAGEDQGIGDTPASLRAGMPKPTR